MVRSADLRTPALRSSNRSTRTHAHSRDIDSIHKVNRGFRTSRHSFAQYRRPLNGSSMISKLAGRTLSLSLSLSHIPYVKSKSGSVKSWCHLACWSATSAAVPDSTACSLATSNSARARSAGNKALVPPQSRVATGPPVISMKTLSRARDC